MYKMKRFSFYSLASVVFVLAILILMVCNGCGVINLKTKDSGQACANIPEGSYSVICEISHKVGQEPEDIASVLKLANISGLTTDAYAAIEAKAFIADVREYVVNARKISAGFTYKELVQYVVAKYSLLPKKVQALLIVLDDYAVINDGEISLKCLSEYDFDLIDSHLEEQDRIADVFLESVFLEFLDDYVAIYDGDIHIKGLSEYDFDIVDSLWEEQDRIVDVFLGSAFCVEIPVGDKTVY